MSAIKSAKAALRKDLKQKINTLTDAAKKKQSDVVTRKVITWQAEHAYALPALSWSADVSLYYVHFIEIFFRSIYFIGELTWK